MKGQNCDLILMCMHTGGQYNPTATDDTKKLVQFLLARGVNIIAGTHEHVVHGGEFASLKKGQLATYSLGNFDGVAGVYDKPFDKMAEYSIAWHVYVNKEGGSARLTRTSFTVLKSVKDPGKEGGIILVPVFDLIRQCSNSKEKEKLINDLYEIARRFSEQDVSGEGVQLEYFI